LRPGLPGLDKNGEPLAFINDGILAAVSRRRRRRHRREISRARDAHVVGMLGSGGMARTFLDAFKCVRDIRLCKVYSPTAANREAFAQEMFAPLQYRGARSRQRTRGGARRRHPVDLYRQYGAGLRRRLDREGMHVTNLGRREMPDASADKFDLVVRQGTAGLQLRQSERFQAERGLSPAAFIGGTVEEMKRLPPKEKSKSCFWRGQPEFTDRGRGGDKPTSPISSPASGKGPHSPIR